MDGVSVTDLLYIAYTSWSMEYYNKGTGILIN